MQVDNKLIFDIIEELAPLALAEEWDNCGLQVGNPGNKVGKILLAMDMDEKVLAEAQSIGANLVITHHPLIFKDIKNIREDDCQGRLLMQIIKSGISVYAAHTNLDSAHRGVNAVLAERLQLQDLKVLKSGGEKYLKLVVFVPRDYADIVREAVSAVGAGWLGNYSHCTYMSEGIGTFKPMEGTNPYIGSTGTLEKVEEIRFETILPAHLLRKVLEAMLDAHPYEEVAYDLYPLENMSQQTGMGRLGRLDKPLTLIELVSRVKEALGVKALRYGGAADGVVNRLAVCGGSGSSLWPAAISGGADVIVTGDIGYHVARDMLAAGLCFIDAGHYWTEQVVLEPLADFLKSRCREKGINVDIVVSSVLGDPFNYI